LLPLYLSRAAGYHCGCANSSVTDQYELDPTNGKNCTKGCWIDIQKVPTITTSKTLKLREVVVLDGAGSALRASTTAISYSWAAGTPTANYGVNLCSDGIIPPTTDTANYCEASSLSGAVKTGPMLRMHFACSLGLSEIQLYVAREGPQDNKNRPDPDITSFQVVVNWRDRSPVVQTITGTPQWSYNYTFNPASYL
jgi:hypothetical protein